MDQELKQRLIGAFVITALAAIFVPMLFDDAVDETGKNVNELQIPAIPTKAQEVEIMPLPEKAEDVATVIPVEKSPKPTQSNAFNEGEPEVIQPVRPAKVLGDTPTTNQRPVKVIEPEPEMAQVDPDGGLPEDAELKPVVTKPSKQPANVVPPANPTTKPVPVMTTPAVGTTPSKPNLGNEPATRWYLNAGSFSQKANATALQESLKQQGFAATIKEANGEKGLVYKVRIGPMLDKAKAQAVKNKLTQINVNTFVATEE